VFKREVLKECLDNDFADFGKNIDRSLIADGCTIEKSTMEHSVIGIRSIIDSDSILKDVILMGADEYETDMIEERADRPRIGIGRACNIVKGGENDYRSTFSVLESNRVPYPDVRSALVSRCSIRMWR
jgi:ADP-glucose pyrophosphorylase